MSRCPPEEALSAHLEGDLDASEAASVEAHLDVCGDCRRVRDELDAMGRGLSSLAEAEPSRDLWAEISIRHNREQKRRPWIQWAIPAFAAAAVAAMALLVWAPPVEQVESTDPRIEKAYQSVVTAERTYIQSITDLEEVVGDRVVPTMTPKARAAIEQGLAQIDVTIQQCRQELERAPHDFNAHRTLLAAYQKKVDLLTELVDRSI